MSYVKCMGLTDNCSLTLSIYECKSVYIDSGYKEENSARNIVVRVVQNVCIVAKLKPFLAKQKIALPLSIR